MAKVVSVGCERESDVIGVLSNAWRESLVSSDADGGLSAADWVELDGGRFDPPVGKIPLPPVFALDIDGSGGAVAGRNELPGSCSGPQHGSSRDRWADRLDESMIVPDNPETAPSRALGEETCRVWKQFRLRGDMQEEVAESRSETHIVFEHKYRRRTQLHCSPQCDAVAHAAGLLGRGQR
jgi:hypothetical protein